MPETTETRTDNNSMAAAEAWSHLETQAFYEGLKNGASDTHRALRTAQKALLDQLEPGHKLQASSVPVTVALVTADGEVIATEDGRAVNMGAWCEHETADCGAEELYVENLRNRSHGWACKACRKIRQAG